MDNLPDIQKHKDDRGIPINRVGVENIRFPLYISTKNGDKVLVYTNINLYGSLKHVVRGINMSRFEDILMQWQYKDISSDSLEQLLIELRNHLGVEDIEDVYAEIVFDYFLTKEGPISKKKSVMNYECAFIGKLRKDYQFQLRVKVLTTSNCPCSKSLSEKGSHGQRSFSTVTVDPFKGQRVWLEDLIKLVESCGSCEVYPLLKRPDEKYVTDKSYQNAKFVEDISRDISLELQTLGSIKKYKIKVVNQESIHPHDAVAYVSRKLEGKVWKIDHSALKS